MSTVVDACGRRVELPATPRRIVSLCPSQTETLYALGLAGRIVGRTRYCIHPAAEVVGAAQVGGTKQLRHPDIARLRPDLIVAEKEENRREDVELLAQSWPVYVTDVRGVDDALQMLVSLGKICDVAAAATALADRITRAWLDLPRLPRPLRVVYLIWRKPYMAAGADTYIDSVLQRLGATNVARDLVGRYPQIDPAWLRSAQADVCLLSSEPYPFAQEHVQEMAELVPGLQSRCVNGEDFSWYGARMLPAAAALGALVQELATLPAGQRGD